jgi:2-polyprenyl-3-methyl-5-hydroxy-6-metoxy-1,4-benzoquinol methylase
VLIINAECLHSFQQIVLLVHGEGRALISRNIFRSPILAGAFTRAGEKQIKQPAEMQSAALVVYSPTPMKTAKRKKEWFDDDSFWRELYPFMFPEERIADADEQIAKALALTKPAGKPVLDLCCGPGRCSIALAKRGFHVTAVDRTAYLLNKARVKANAARVNIEWVQQDMRDFVRPGAFALVLSMFTSFGYFDDRQENMTVLENMFTSLQPGGACLIETLGKERLAKVFSPQHPPFCPTVPSGWNGTRFLMIGLAFATNGSSCATPG